MRRHKGLLRGGKIAITLRKGKLKIIRTYEESHRQAVIALRFSLYVSAIGIQSNNSVSVWHKTHTAMGG